MQRSDIDDAGYWRCENSFWKQARIDEGGKGSSARWDISDQWYWEREHAQYRDELEPEEISPEKQPKNMAPESFTSQPCSSERHASHSDVDIPPPLSGSRYRGPKVVRKDSYRNSTYRVEKHGERKHGQKLGQARRKE